MNDERAVEEIVTKFLLNTCRLRPKFSEPAVLAAVLCAGRSSRKTRHAIFTGTEGNQSAVIVYQNHFVSFIIFVRDLTASYCRVKHKRHSLSSKVQFFCDIDIAVLSVRLSVTVRFCAETA